MKRVLILTAIIITVCLTFAACSCEHQYEEKITTEASCAVAGVKTFSCTKCDEFYTEEIPVIEHSYTSAITKEPTCAEKGVTTFTCSVCSDSYTEDITMIAHTFGEATVTKEPTCVEEGEKSAACTVCGATEVTEKIPTVAHTYKSKTKVAATCTEKGVATLTCSVCQDSKEESIKALGHNYKQSKVIKKVTCTTDGEVTMACSRCKDSYNETKKATGHKWVDASCTKAKYCKNCSLTDGEALGHNYQNGKCTRCGKNSSSVKFKDSFPVTFRVKSYKCDITITKASYKIKNYSNGQIDLTINITGYLTNHDGSAKLNDHTFRIFILDSNGNKVTGTLATLEEYGGTTGTVSRTVYDLPVGDYYVDFRSV